MTALLLDILRCPRCGGTYLHVAGEPACTCVTPEAVAARTGHSDRLYQAWELLRLVRKLHEIEQRPLAGREGIDIADGELRVPCECCGYETMNDVTFLEDAYAAAGLG